MMRRFSRPAAAVGMATVAAALLLPSAVGASTPGVQPDWNPGGIVEDVPPDSAFADFGGCPSPSQFPLIYPPLLDENGDPVLGDDGLPVQDTSADPTGNVSPFVCLKLTAYNGELKLGDTVARIDAPLDIYVGAAFDGTTVIGNGGGGGGFAPVKIPGGILGIPELDPLLDLTLGLLSVSASPQIGAAGAGHAGDPPSSGLDGPGGQLLGWAWDAYPYVATDPVKLNIPLSIKLNNTLFGDRCEIPEFTINLTTGSTTPPPGVAPMTGEQEGEFRGTSYEGIVGDSTGSMLSARVGTTFVDNTFAVPAASRCDLLPQGVHDGIETVNDALEGALGTDLPLDELAGSDAGLFDGLIAGQTGLPSPAGNNYARFDVDVAVSYYNGFTGAINVTPQVCGPFCELYGFAPEPMLEFGSVPIGSSETRTATVTNAGAARLSPIFPPEIGSMFAAPDDDYVISNDGCAGRTLAHGESCTVDVTFTPTTAGDHPSAFTVHVRDEAAIALTGSGV